MGFFSWNCAGCGESIKAPYEVPKRLAHQVWAVVINDGRVTHNGKYDGYGRIGGEVVEDCVAHITMWHRQCWYEAGEPMGEHPCDFAEDQGFFYDRKTTDGL